MPVYIYLWADSVPTKTALYGLACLININHSLEFIYSAICSADFEPQGNSWSHYILHAWTRDLGPFGRHANGLVWWYLAHVSRKARVDPFPGAQHIRSYELQLTNCSVRCNMQVSLWQLQNIHVHTHTSTILAQSLQMTTISNRS